ncbi:enoyl-CoA hydratase-related protein [Nocardia sp. BMG111209]|uniref:enoyl-CoA hydratase-related protein n=1 Tax=Nocardia sp. BMG111209 TaxID=1160137 RepID=UPI00036630CD|nr:enoyl-CoA hydratase-related protein [Nocardia sp. BMG111209]
MSADLVLYDVEDAVATITLNRPELANAQNMPMLDDLDAAWTRAERDPEVRVIVLRGNGKHFSSGHDIDPRTWNTRDPEQKWLVSMGIGGVEYHGHTWELGARLAKEILFTGRPIDAEEAHRVGMVNRVVPRDDLESATRQLAVEIAAKHPFALRMAKRAVNQTLDIQGFTAAVRAVFDIHQLGHAHAISECGVPVLIALDGMKKQVSG